VRVVICTDIGDKSERERRLERRLNLGLTPWNRREKADPVRLEPGSCLFVPSYSGGTAELLPWLDAHLRCDLFASRRH
jgi:hypothetical protein